MKSGPAPPRDGGKEGRCLCGCRGVTTVARKTDRRYGDIKGKPRRFIRGHHRKLPDRARYTVENRGRSTPCWVWLGHVGASGYGHAGGQLAHRYFYEKYVGPIPENLVLHHICGVKKCVNPDHPRPVSKRENSLNFGKSIRTATTNIGAGQATYAEEDQGYITRCWIWQGRIDSTGYGRLGRWLAHRVMYEHSKGRIPDGMDLDHLCSIRSCVNPQHLEAVTRAENVRRGKLGKLKSEMVRRIRADRVSTYRELGDEYGVTPGYVGMVKNGRTWKDVS